MSSPTHHERKRLSARPDRPLPPIDRTMPGQGRMREQMPEQVGQHGQPVPAEHRLRVELHPGEARPAQRVHRPVRRVPGQLHRPVRGGHPVGVGASGEAGVEADPAGRPEHVTSRCSPWYGAVPPVQRQPEQPGRAAGARGRPPAWAGRRPAGPASSARSAAIFGVGPIARVTRPGTDHHQVVPVDRAGLAASRGGRPRRPSAPSWWASIPVKVSSPSTISARRPASPGSADAPGRALVQPEPGQRGVAGGQRGAYLRVVGAAA